MAGDADEPVYYVISDLHIGGDEQLEEVEFLAELLGFLERLEQTDENAELLINGDAFGLWEFTTIDGPAKFDVLEETYPELFAQLRATGETVQITLVPGNHDHELAAYDEYVDRLAAYNVELVQDQSITRELNGREIHVEHGNQQDPNNHIADWGNPRETPIGYHYNTHVTSRAGQLSDRGRYNWLKDVQAVTPTERMPSWLVSKYFYREMNPLLRYAAVPILLLINVSILMALLAGLDLAGIWSTPIDRIQAFLRGFGRAGRSAYLLFWTNVVIAGILLLIAIPLSLFVRDVRKTVERFGIFETPLTVDPDEPYVDAAREVFDARPETAVFCYGHTHRPRMRDVDDRLLVNTGTWLKRLHRREVIAGRLPPVFYPSYQLCAVRISAGDEPGEVVVDYEEIDKPSPTAEELTLTERLLTVGRTPDTDLPDRAVVPADPTVPPAREGSPPATVDE